jgi:ketosteroid isomerase-like protein
MKLSKSEILELFRVWITAWNEHDLDGVMAPMHEEVVFEGWAGASVSGTRSLRWAWTPWFRDHGDFRFTEEDVFVDEQEQKLLFRWVLEWPATEGASEGMAEIRRGVDVLHLLDGRIHRKYSYSKTVVHTTRAREAGGMT